MKKILIKYRSVVIIAVSLIFNLVSSLLVWRPDGVVFNKTPLTITEAICDIVATVGIFLGIAILFFDSNRDEKKSMEEAFRTGAEELRKVNVEFEVKEKE